MNNIFLDKIKYKISFKLSISLIILLLSFFYAVAYFPEYEPFPKLTSDALSWALKLFNISTFAFNDFLNVSFNGIIYSIQLSAECSGVGFFLMFLIVVFLLPEYSLIQKFVAIPFIIILFVANVFRIILGILLGIKYGPFFLIVFHDTIGQALIFLVVIISFIAWLKLVNKFPHEKSYREDMNYD